MAPLVGIERAQELLGGADVAPIKTIRRWVQQGRLRAYRPGKHLLFRETDLEAFVAASIAGAPKPIVKARSRAGVRVQR
jgi:excisionase family DNA binding protein